MKLSKKNKKSYEAVIKKIGEIINSTDIEHYKNLRYNMKDSKRVHLGHFVLVFSYDTRKNQRFFVSQKPKVSVKLKDFVSFEDFDHHDRIYK